MTEKMLRALSAKIVAGRDAERLVKPFVKKMDDWQRRFAVLQRSGLGRPEVVSMEQFQSLKTEVETALADLSALVAESSGPHSRVVDVINAMERLQQSLQTQIKDR